MAARNSKGKTDSNRCTMIDADNINSVALSLAVADRNARFENGNVVSRNGTIIGSYDDKAVYMNEAVIDAMSCDYYTYEGDVKTTDQFKITFNGSAGPGSIDYCVIRKNEQGLNEAFIKNEDGTIGDRIAEYDDKGHVRFVNPVEFGKMHALYDEYYKEQEREFYGDNAPETFDRPDPYAAFVNNDINIDHDRSSASVLIGASNDFDNKEVSDDSFPF